MTLNVITIKELFVTKAPDTDGFKVSPFKI